MAAARRRIAPFIDVTCAPFAIFIDSSLPCYALDTRPAKRVSPFWGNGGSTPTSPRPQAARPLLPRSADLVEVGTLSAVSQHQKSRISFRQKAVSLPERAAHLATILCRSNGLTKGGRCFYLANHQPYLFISTPPNEYFMSRSHQRRRNLMVGRPKRTKNMK